MASTMECLWTRRSPTRHWSRKLAMSNRQLFNQETVSPSSAGLTESFAIEGTSDVTGRHDVAARTGDPRPWTCRTSNHCAICWPDSRTPHPWWSWWSLMPTATGPSKLPTSWPRYHDLDAVHIFSHGTAQGLQLGSTWLDAQTIENHTDAIHRWQSAFSTSGDLLFYACDLAASDEGRALLDTIGDWTATDVAASTDRTGTAYFGGDWVLEFQTGRIESDVAAGAQVQRDWFGLMSIGVDATTTATATSDISISHTTSGTDRVMLVGVSIASGSADTVTSMTYNGASLTRVGFQNAPASNTRVEIWSLVAPDAGTYNLDVYFSGNPDGATIGIMTFTGVDQATALGIFASDAGNGATNGSATVNSAAGERVFAAVVVEAGDQDLAPDGSQTEDWDLIAGQANGGGSTVAGAASVNTSWSWSASANWAIAGVSLKPASASNTAPTLDSAKSPALSPINEDAGPPSGAVGTLVSALVDFASPSGQVDNVTDVDGGALLGVAVTAADTTNGTWYYSTDNGTTWNALGAVSSNNARLLAADANTRLYFQPVANYNGTLATAVTFRAWDQTSGSNGTLADTTTSGGTTAFSTTTDTASLTINAVNDAPVLDDSQSPTLAAQNEDSGAPSGAVGTLVSALVDFASPAGQVDNVTDVDSGAQLGIAVTAADSSNGSWWYSTNNGVSWNALGAVTSNNARLLAADANTRLYFQPNANYSGTLADRRHFPGLGSDQRQQWSHGRYQWQRRHDPLLHGHRYRQSGDQPGGRHAIGDQRHHERGYADDQRAGDLPQRRRRRRSDAFQNHRCHQRYALPERRHDADQQRHVHHLRPRQCRAEVHADGRFQRQRQLRGPGLDLQRRRRLGR